MPHEISMLPDVLIVEDEPLIAAALKVRLTASGWSVRHAANGLTAVDEATARPPRAMLLDIRLPGIDGFEVCRRVRSEPSTRDVPVIFMSANVQDEARFEAQAAGGQAFIRKPYEAEEILSALQSLAGNGSI
jgi:CheY-like chemotaxis protein